MNPPNDVNQNTPGVAPLPPTVPDPQLNNPSFNQTISPNPISTNPTSPIANKLKSKHLVLKWIGAIVGIFVLLGVIGGVIAFVATSGPVKVADEQFNDMKQGNMQAAYDLFASDAKAQTSFDEFQTAFSKYGIQSDSSASLSFSGREVKNNQAQLSGSMKINGISRGVTYGLIQENGQWKVDLIDIKPAQ